MITAEEQDDLELAERKRRGLITAILVLLLIVSLPILAVLGKNYVENRTYDAICKDNPRERYATTCTSESECLRDCRSRLKELVP